MYGTVLNEE